MLWPFSVQKTGTTPDLNLPRPSEQKVVELRRPTARFVAGGRKPDLFREAQIFAEAVILVKLSHLIFTVTDPFSNRNGLLCQMSTHLNMAALAPGKKWGVLA